MLNAEGRVYSGNLQRPILEQTSPETAEEIMQRNHWKEGGRGVRLEGVLGSKGVGVEGDRWRSWSLVRMWARRERERENPRDTD